MPFMVKWYISQAALILIGLATSLHVASLSLLWGDSLCCSLRQLEFRHLVLMLPLFIFIFYFFYTCWYLSCCNVSQISLDGVDTLIMFSSLHLVYLPDHVCVPSFIVHPAGHLTSSSSSIPSSSSLPLRMFQSPCHRSWGSRWYVTVFCWMYSALTVFCCSSFTSINNLKEPAMNVHHDQNRVHLTGSCFHRGLPKTDI